jgi:hypothetical protein
MVRTQIQLEEEQYKKIKELANQQQVSIASVIRRAVDQLLETRRPARASLYKEALKSAGKYSAGRPDIATEHDTYLDEAYR